MTNSPDFAPDANAARKMAVVDALSAANRAIVHEIGLYDFKQRHPAAYRRAKASAGVTGSTRKTQQDRPRPAPAAVVEVRAY